MSQYTMIYFCNEKNKLVGSLNYLSWKKIIDLIFVENEFSECVMGSIIKPYQEKYKVIKKYMKGEIRAPIILIESIEDSLINYVAKLKTSKEIYE